MRCSIKAASAAAVLVFASVPASCPGSPVISEIMYRPGTGFPENTELEYIEVYNPGTESVNVGGWAFRSGVAYTFPESTLIPAGGYLVVAANPAALQTVFSSVTALGPWLAGATLSNNGEKITLSMPGTIPGTWSKVDEVTYASEGDWARRTRESTWGGWDWTTPANGGGKSVELRNPALSNDNGQNWSASTAAAGGTPGAANSVNAANVPPVIHSVRHSPAVPASTDSVTVSCEINDEDAAAARTATLFFRNATTGSPPAFSSAAMVNDGNGKLTAILPAQADKTITEFYISSSDGTAIRTWPAATNEGQNANCQYQVDNEIPSTTSDTYRLTLTAAENSAFQNVSQSSDRQFNQTLIVTRGTESQIRYAASMRIRGNSSRSYQFKPLRIAVPNDEDLDGSTSFNLNPKASFLQYMGMKLFQAAGLPAPDVLPVELRRNGVNSTTGGGSTPDYGKWVRMEDLSAAMTDNHWPAASGGNLYKKGRPDEFWRSTAAAPSNPDGLLDGWSKQNNSSANDWSDLQGFFNTWQSVAAPYFPGAPAGDVAAGSWNGTPFSVEDMDTIGTVADTSQWARWFAVMTLLQSNETNISNGQDDDYSCYFIPSPGGQRRMQLLPHDLDTIFGMGDSPLSATSRGLYDSTEDGSAFASLYPLMGTSSGTGNPDFRAGYHNAIRELCGTVFSDTAFAALVDYHLADWAPAGTLTAIKSFNSARSTHLLGLIGAGATTPPAPTATATLTKSHGPLMISEILAANTTALNNGGTYPDVIELHNSGTTSIDLDGMSLSDNPEFPQKFTFTGSTVLPAGGFLVIFADTATGAPGLHTGFSLEQGGDSLSLYDTAANGAAVIDSISFGPQAANHSIGRTGAGLTIWTLCSPAFGAANTAVTAASPEGLRINEWLGNPDFRVNDDFLELHNGSNLPVAMGNMRITNDFASYPARHVLPPLSFAGPGAFQVYKAKGSSASPGNPSELPFSIDSTFGWLALLGANGTIVDAVDTVSHRRDTPAGRSPDSGSTLTTFSVPSPGLPNGSLPAAYQGLLDSLRITEFIYKPNGGNDYEFIELLNTGTSKIDLSGVRFTNGVDYTYPAGTELAAGAFSVVCRNRTAFLSRFPGAEPVLAPGEYAGALDNNGETITLSLPNPWDVAILNFNYQTGWEALSFSSGHSLTAVDAMVTAPRDWNERATWTASTTPDGTPGSDGPPGITSPLTASGITGDAFSYQITAARGPTAWNAQGLPAGLTVNTASGLISGTLAQAGNYPVAITASNSTGADTKTLILTVSSSGPLHHFTWDFTPTAAEPAVPFPAWITARDETGRTVTAFNGAVQVSATSSGPGTSPSSVFITEVTDEAEDQFELQNTGTATVNTAGWYVVIGNSTTIASVNAVTWALPASVEPGATLRVSEFDNQPGRSYFGGGIAWTVSLNRGWIMLVDATNTVRDFMAWGWPEAELAGLGFTVNGAAITTAGSWTGNGAPPGTRANNNNSWQRTGTGDTNTAGDWSYATDATSWGVTNSGLTLPWNTGPVVNVHPASLTFTSGVFTGFLTVNETAPAVRLKATDALLRSGQSAAFDINNASADSDGDRMPDTWEAANALNPSGDDSGGDPDGDGLTNLAEYYAGTNPGSGASGLGIASWGAAPGEVSLTWPVQPGRIYRIAYSTGLTGWNWIPDRIFAPSAAGMQNATFAPPPGTAGRAFYRVELLTP